MPLAATITCLGTLLSEFAFDQAQQHAIPELLELSGTKIPAAYTRECTKQELSEGLEWLVATTQLQFFARLGERYHDKIPRWIETHSTNIIQISEDAGFLSEVKPQRKK
ncbi:MAG: hypothetical protein KBC27_03440 [Rickettsiales bacterium]|nr:hypothetical protein [Rickettsiales bacterium]